MKISLKNILTERVVYAAPRINIFDKHDKNNLNASKKMFYDFYAMEYLHRVLGTPLPMSVGVKVKAAKLDPNFGAGFLSGTNWDDVEYPSMGAQIVPSQLRKVIDDVFEQVTRSIGKKISTYLRLALMQELRHIFSYSNSLSNLRYKLQVMYSQNEPLSASKFKELVKYNVPEMVGHEDSLIRIIKFSSNYKKTSEKTEFEAPINATPEIPPSEPQTVEPQEPEKHPLEIDPNDEYYKDFDNGLNPDDWETNDPFYDPETTNESFLFEDEHESEQEYTVSGKLSPKVVKHLNRASNNAKLTWQDVENAYNKIHWNTSSFGGKKWGTGVTALLKLMPELTDHDYEKVASSLDHIFDLVHNSGPMLNKGAFNIPNDVLDRRSRITHPARYLNDVSPVVKNLINRCLPYLSGNPEDERNVDKYISEPSISLTPEIINQFEELGFYVDGLPTENNPLETRIVYKDKNNYDRVMKYHLKFLPDNKSVLFNTEMSDVHVFHSMEDLLTNIKKNIEPKIQKVDKYQQYKDTHGITVLSKPQALQLLEINMKFNDIYGNDAAYKGEYFVSEGNGGFLELKAYTDMTLTTHFYNDKKFKIFKSFDEAFAECSAQNEIHKFVLADDVKAQTKATLTYVAPPPKPYVDPYAYNKDKYGYTNQGDIYSHHAPKNPDLDLPGQSASAEAYSYASLHGLKPIAIRLTGMDENSVLSHGFKLHKKGNIVAYRHSVNGDLVVFYNNYEGKIYKSGLQVAITKPLNDMLDYIGKYYTPTGFQGPTTPTAPSSYMKNPITGKTSGKKVAPLIEGNLIKQGFSWDAAAGEYVDKNSMNTIRINLNNSAVVKLNKSGITYPFPNLSALISYLNGKYIQDKAAENSPSAHSAASLG